MQKTEKPLKQILLSLLTVALLCLSAVSVLILYPAASTSDTAYSESALSLTDGTKSLREEAVNATEVVGTRKKGVQNFLLCGKDRASGLYDVIILAQLNTETDSASLVQIPRDTYAAYTERQYRKLNGAASALGGAKQFSGFLSENLGVPIDHYALFDLDCIGDMVDAVGGVTLTVPTDMDYEDSAQNLSIHLKAGTQTLNGDSAEQFLRFRSGYVTADLGRLDAQKLFLSALLTEVREHSSLPTIIRIVRSLYGRVETDLSLGDCIKLASAGLKLSPERLSMSTLPGEAARTEKTSGAWYYILCKESAYDTVNRMLNVYDTPLPVSSFDPKERFTDSTYPHFDAIYHGTKATEKPIDGNSASTHYGTIPRISG